MITITNALMSLRPGAQWSLENDDYSTISWYSAEIPQPTEAEVNAEIKRLTEIEPLMEAKKNRMLAYEQESDPLFFKVQRGEADMQEWKDKIEEIRARYPYPEE
jgi:hypothetical protein